MLFRVYFLVGYKVVRIFFYRKVVEKTKKQLDKLWHTTNIYMHPKIHEFADELTSKLPGDLKVTHCSFF